MDRRALNVSLWWKEKKGRVCFHCLTSFLGRDMNIEISVGPFVKLFKCQFSNLSHQQVERNKKNKVFCVPAIKLSSLAGTFVKKRQLLSQAGPHNRRASPPSQKIRNSLDFFPLRYLYSQKRAVIILMAIVFFFYTKINTGWILTHRDTAWTKRQSYDN